MPHFAFPHNWRGWLIVLVGAFAGLVVGGITLNFVADTLGKVLEAP